MKLLVYSAKDYEIPFLDKARDERIRTTYTSAALDSQTALQAAGFDAISIFSGDDACLLVLEKLKALGVKYITLRSVGYNNIHVKSAKRLGLKVANAPNYSPHSIAEFAMGLLLSINRKIAIANTQVHKYNFSQDKLLGFNLRGKTVGLVGTGRIGKVMAKLVHGFECNIIAHDLISDTNLVNEYGVEYMSLENLCKNSDIISLHLPLTQETHHLLGREEFKIMKSTAILVNTARGAVVNTKALINSIEKKEIAAYATDVYEKEKGTFFRDNSKTGISDEMLKKLLSFENVLLTPHQAFVTHEALEKIAETTYFNLTCWLEGKECENELGYETLIS
ncbi:D-lactate dehydrogenase [Saonia flava]|uniref:D-lactate dehydrogenase n=1 Tax=Saonia flava TaxID=523696 RepID=A0A846QT65_9FLAO|nr:2-hydroxyacid dehydrogenase [Saonia flava]NJB72156.1 D-lactate dehydrogenase [Saonia flava]